MRFWDSSALVPLFSIQQASEEVAELLRADTGMTVWWGTWIECAVAISRLKREGSMNDDAEEESRVALSRLAEDWAEILPTNGLRLLAMLISRDHPLRAADTLQLAAALRWCEGDTRNASFVCLDDRLRQAASAEGFDVPPEMADEEDES